MTAAGAAFRTNEVKERWSCESGHLRMMCHLKVRCLQCGTWPLPFSQLTCVLLLAGGCTPTAQRPPPRTVHRKIRQQRQRAASLHIKTLQNVTPKQPSRHQLTTFQSPKSQMSKVCKEGQIRTLQVFPSLSQLFSTSTHTLKSV